MKPVINQPLTPTDIKFVSHMLFEYGQVNAINSFDELEGFFIGIVSHVKPLSPRQWYPVIWGGAGHEPAYADDAEMERCIGLLIRHLNNCAGLLMDQAHPHYRLYATDQQLALQHWCRGYIKAMHCAEMPALPPEEAQYLADIATWAEVLSAEQLTHIQAALPVAMLGLHRYSLAERQKHIPPNARMAASEPVRLQVRNPAPIPSSVMSTKSAGRNDACPCGSGKKFKKCCLH